MAVSLALTACGHARYARNPIPCRHEPPVPVPSTLGIKADELERSDFVYALEKGGDNLIARAWLCDQAQKTLDIQYYIFARDNTGLIACEFIVRAAERGVKVRLIIDDATVKPNPTVISLLDSHPNIEIRVYNPGIKMGTLRLRARKIIFSADMLHRRMHNKAIIIDNLVSITGGRNIADEYFDYDRKYNFRDRDILMIGRVSRDVTGSFEQFWNDTLCMPYAKVVKYAHRKKYSNPARFDWLHSYACDPKNFSGQMRQRIASFPPHFRALLEQHEVVPTGRVSYVSDTPDKNLTRGYRGGISTDTMIALLAGTQKAIDIQSPYLVLTPEWERLFRELTARGVKVRALTNSLGSTDNFEAFSAYQRDRKKILDLGVVLYEYKPHPAIRFKIMNSEVQDEMGYKSVIGMHSKTLIIDGKVVMIGAYNLDARSADFNTESIAVVRSQEFAKTVSKYVEEEFSGENAWLVTREFNGDRKASLKKRIKVATRRVIPKKYL
jgi:cardiolipin synthase C